MQHDRYGNAVTTGSAAAVAAYDRGVDHVLAATFGAEDAFAEAIAADDGFALAHVGAARAAMYAGDMAAAKTAIARADAVSGGVTAREAAQIETFTYLLSGRPVEARRATEAHVREHPRDVMVAQLCTNIFGLIGLSGEPGREAAQLAYTTALHKALGDDWWVLSVHGQAVCEVGRLDEALSLMERSLELNNANANASHFKAHTLYEQGETSVGRAYLADWMSDYDRRALLHGHLSWHEALWALEQGDAEAVWATYDSSIAPEASYSLPLNVLTDAAALLWRAEVAGLPVPRARWAELSAYATRFFPEVGLSFADMHAALAHAMAGEGAALAKIAEASRGYAAAMVAPVAKAWGAVARSDWTGALEHLQPVMSDHARIGGSRAQRDLLELTWMLCLLRTGQTEEARRCAAIRRPIFSPSAPIAGLA